MVTRTASLAECWDKCHSQIEELLAKEDNVSTEGTATFRAKVAAARKRKQFNKPGGNKNPKATVVNSMTYSRDPNVVAWVQAEAKGKCEYCKKWGPFKSSLNERYLEVHHVRPLSDRGPDVVANAVALCPNCHRAFHYSIDRAERTKELYRQVSRLE